MGVREGLGNIRTLVAVTLALAEPLASAAVPVELKRETVEAFNTYVRLTEARIERELAEAKNFLWPDSLPAEQRRQAYEALRAGQVLIQEQQTRDARGQDVEIPDGMVHHWLGVAFLPGVRLERALALAQDFDHAERYFGPDIQESKLLAREGERFLVWMRLRRKKIVTVVLNTTQEAVFGRISPAQAFSRSESLRIAEVENPDTPEEKEKLVGNDRGFLWRMNTYWRYEEKDGGTYVQLEAIALSRQIPLVLRWFVAPLVKSAAREYLTHILESFRRALVGKPGERAREGLPLLREATPTGSDVLSCSPDGEAHRDSAEWAGIEFRGPGGCGG